MKNTSSLRLNIYINNLRYDSPLYPFNTLLTFALTLPFEISQFTNSSILANKKAIQDLVLSYYYYYYYYHEPVLFGKTSPDNSTAHYLRDTKASSSKSDRSWWASTQCLLGPQLILHAATWPAQAHFSLDIVPSTSVI